MRLRTCLETARAEIKRALPSFNKKGRVWVWGPNARAFLRDGCDAKVGAEPGFIRNPAETANALTQTNAPTAAAQNRTALACTPSRPPAMPWSLGPASRALNAASIPALDKTTAPVSAENKTQSTTHHCHEHVLSTQTPTTVTITADHLYQENVLPTPTHTPITAGHLPPPLTTAGRSPPGHPRPRRGLAGQACTPTQAHW